MYVPARARNSRPNRFIEAEAHGEKFKWAEKGGDKNNHSCQ